MESDKMGRIKKKTFCQDCKKVFSSRIEYQKHRKEEHSRKNMCTICKRIFESEKRLRMHSQFHSIDGEYKCFYCSKRFNKGWKMRIHLVNHSGRPPYTCEFCGDDFLYPGKIVKHLKFLHDIYYACKDCGQAIPVDYNEGHECKVYGCKDCIMCFTTEKELATHVENNVHGERYIHPTPIVPCENITLTNSTIPQETLVHDVNQPDISSSVKQMVPRVENHKPCVPPHSTTSTTVDLHDSSILQNKTSLTHEDNVNKQEDIGDGREGLKGDTVTESAKSDEQDHKAYNTSFRLLVCDVANNTRDLLLVQGNKTQPHDMVRIKKEEEEDIKPTSHGYLVSESITRSLSPQFKVPETSKKCKGSSRSMFESSSSSSSLGKLLYRKGDEPIKTSQNKRLDEPLKTPKYRRADELKVSSNKNKNNNNNKRGLLDNLNNSTSFESWLSSDLYASPEHDYVFGFEASVSVDTGRSDKHHYHHHHYHHHHHLYSTKKIQKKEKADMTFEDLCQF